MGILRHYCICSCEERAQRAAPLSYGRSRRTQKPCHLDLLVICLLLTIRMVMQLSKNISHAVSVTASRLNHTGLSLDEKKELALFSEQSFLLPSYCMSRLNNVN